MVAYFSLFYFLGTFIYLLAWVLIFPERLRKIFKPAVDEVVDALVWNYGLERIRAKRLVYTFAGLVALWNGIVWPISLYRDVKCGFNPLN